MKKIFVGILLLILTIILLIAVALEAIAKISITLCFLCVFPIVAILYPWIKNVECATIGFVYTYGTDWKNWKLATKICEKYKP